MSQEEEECMCMGNTPTINSDNVDDNDCFYCDVCGKTVSQKWYHKSLPGADCFDCCLECIDNIEFEEIDRTECNTDDKPLVWPCVSCQKKLGGGFKWYTFDDKLDICIECHNSGKIKECLNLVDYSSHKYMIIERTCPLLVCCDDPVENTTEYKSFDDYLDSVVFYDYNCNESIKNWRILVEAVHEDWGYDAECGFLINIKTGQIASYVIDDHGRISIDRAYENIQEYQNNLDLWEKNKLLENERENTKNTVKESFQNNGSCDDEIICKCVGFPIYFRLNSKLGMYYG